MSNAEHLIENAISVIEAGRDFNEYASMKLNCDMAKMSDIRLRDVWEMATYVVFTLKPYWEGEWWDKLETKRK